ncbi:hypothetical protein DPMN_087947 [Dreissena polymorpha]|uniref:Uncharacterized protein n=1 Tax=Dreissena polymorpha TaxID=45954 RepID=A0A9D4KTP9_DREPO|nr:hypothetical protein DPMN_087947 [Dreissena polymorpha]
MEVYLRDDSISESESDNESVPESDHESVPEPGQETESESDQQSEPESDMDTYVHVTVVRVSGVLMDTSMQVLVLFLF